MELMPSASINPTEPAHGLEAARTPNLLAARQKHAAIGNGGIFEKLTKSPFPHQRKAYPIVQAMCHALFWKTPIVTLNG